MVAVKQKNIPVIELLKKQAGKRFNEYLGITGRTGNASSEQKTAIDFAGNNAEIIKLLSVEDDGYESDEYAYEEYIHFNVQM